MKILLNTGCNKSGTREIEEALKALMNTVFDDFSDYINGLEAKFTHNSSDREFENDKKSIPQTRVKGMQLLVVISDEDSLSCCSTKR
jgi:hypothetical protein